MMQAQGSTPTAHVATTHTLSRRLHCLAICLALLFISLPTVASQPSQAPVLRLATDSWPPFTDVAERQRVAVDLVETALDRAGITAITTVAPWKDVEAGIRRGAFDGSPALWRTPQRQREMLFSEPYLENRLVLVGRRGSDVKATRIADLGGTRVAAVGQYAYGDEVEQGTGILFVNSRNDQDSLDKLLAEEVEYMLVDALVARYLMTFQAEETAAKLEIGTTPLARRTLHFTVRRELPAAADIIAAFDREIRGMLADGTYARILNVGWIRVDVDGDGLAELVTFGETIGQRPPGAVYDVFGDAPETPPEKQRVFIQGNIYEGWAAIPDRYKGPTEQGDVAFKRGVTLFTLQF